MPLVAREVGKGLGIGTQFGSSQFGYPIVLGGRGVFG